VGVAGQRCPPDQPFQQWSHLCRDAFLVCPRHERASCALSHRAAPITPSRCPPLQAQCGGQAVALRDGSVVACLDVAGSRGLAPELVALQPLAVTPDYQHSFLLTGSHIGGSHDEVFCRHKGALCCAEPRMQCAARCLARRRRVARVLLH
jgi:hypothetical protein